jgi:hypothetical protein
MAEQAKQNTPDDEAVIAVNLSKIRTAQDNAASHHGTLRRVLKHAEGKGVHLKAAKRALAIVKSGDADAWLEETRETTRYLRILRHGITESQLKLDFGTTLEPMGEKAANDGRLAGLDVDEKATEETNPHDLNTASGQAWLAAFRQGRAERDIILSMQDAEDDESEDDEDQEAA